MEKCVVLCKKNQEMNQEIKLLFEKRDKKVKKQDTGIGREKNGRIKREEQQRRRETLILKQKVENNYKRKEKY